MVEVARMITNMIISPPTTFRVYRPSLLLMWGYVFTGVIAGKREAARSSISTDFLVPQEVPQHFFELRINK